MTLFDFDFFKNPFLQMALIGGLLASVASGIVGTFVTVRRITSISGSIAHSILGGVGLFYWLQVTFHISSAEPLLGALVFALCSAMFMGYIHLRFKEREDAMIAATWSTGMGLGILFFSLAPGYRSELSSVLFGNILLITSRQITFLFILDVFLILFFSLFFNRLVLTCFDEEQAILQKIKTKRYYLILLGFVSVTTVLLMEVVGVILVIALLTIPTMLAMLFSKKLKNITFLSVLFSFLFILFGIVLSYFTDIPPGATISLFAAISYVSTLLVQKYLLNSR